MYCKKDLLLRPVGRFEQYCTRFKFMDDPESLDQIYRSTAHRNKMMHAFHVAPCFHVSPFSLSAFGRHFEFFLPSVSLFCRSPRLSLGAGGRCQVRCTRPVARSVHQSALLSCLGRHSLGCQLVAVDQQQTGVWQSVRSRERRRVGSKAGHERQGTGLTGVGCELDVSRHTSSRRRTRRRSALARAAVAARAFVGY